MGIDADRLAAAPAQEVPDGRTEPLALDIPQCHVNAGNGGHGHGAAPPVRTPVKVLPDCLYVARLTPDKQRDHVL